MSDTDSHSKRMNFSPTWHMSDEENADEEQPKANDNEVEEDNRSFARGLVSYLDDDDEEEESSSDRSSEHEESPPVDVKVEVLENAESDQDNNHKDNSSENILSGAILAPDPSSIQLPPEPAGLCSMELQDKVDKALRRMQYDLSYDLNKSIQDNKSFRNPSIYEKLISFLGIDEKGTNYPLARFNPNKYPPGSYYDELAKAQNREIERVEKLKKEQAKNKDAIPISITTDSNSTTDNNLEKGALAAGFSGAAGRKRSKWNNSPPPSATLVADSTATSSDVTVSESTVVTISASGSLTKISK